MVNCRGGCCAGGYLCSYSRWYIDESETRVLKEKELEELPVLFDYPHPPAGYDYTLLKQQ
ncbi:hypothetical protein NZJ93_07905 [Desulfofundulus thermocisternus]|nr:hypothetical protein [Desulfofundulus thermocisternus]